MYQCYESYVFITFVIILTTIITLTIIVTIITVSSTTIMISILLLLLIIIIIILFIFGFQDFEVLAFKVLGFRRRSFRLPRFVLRIMGLRVTGYGFRVQVSRVSGQGLASQGFVLAVMGFRAKFQGYVSRVRVKSSGFRGCCSFGLGDSGLGGEWFGLSVRADEPCFSHAKASTFANGYANFSSFSSGRNGPRLGSFEYLQVMFMSR